MQALRQYGQGVRGGEQQNPLPRGRAGLARLLREAGHVVHGVGRPDRRLRRRHGKTDHLDAESAARAVLGGQATALPKGGTGRV